MAVSRGALPHARSITLRESTPQVVADRAIAEEQLESGATRGYARGWTP
jgi:hypothetical protein